MSLTDGHQAIIGRIVAEAGATSVVLPNGPGKGLPRYVVQEAGGTQRPIGVDGMTDATAEVVVRVETEAGAYATEANALASALVAMFPGGLRFDGMTVMDAPSVRPPLPVADGVYARRRTPPPTMRLASRRCLGRASTVS